MTHVWIKWLWYLYSGDDSDFSVLVITPGDHSCTGNDSDICMLVMTLIYWYWCWLLSCVLLMNLIFIYQYTSDICVLVMTLTSVYCWWLWYMSTGEDSDNCVLVMTLTSDTCLSTERSNLPSHFISHSQIYIIHMFTFNYRKCTLSREFNLIKRALNWELALPGKSGSQISP